MVFRVGLRFGVLFFKVSVGFVFGSGGGGSVYGGGGDVNMKKSYTWLNLI
jgi:hypothetical protein